MLFVSRLPIKAKDDRRKTGNKYIGKGCVGVIQCFHCSLRWVWRLQEEKEVAAVAGGREGGSGSRRKRRWHLQEEENMEAAGGRGGGGRRKKAW